MNNPKFLFFFGITVHKSMNNPNSRCSNPKLCWKNNEKKKIGTEVGIIGTQFGIIQPLVGIIEPKFITKSVRQRI